MAKLIAYFKGGNSMKIDSHRLIIASEQTDPAFALQDALEGKVVINWDNVTALCRFYEKGDDPPSNT